MFKADERVRETSTTTGTGTYTRDGAPAGFQAFTVLGANSYTPYFATDDVNWEVGIGRVLVAPERLERTHVFASSNAGAAVNWGATTKKLRCGLPAAMGFARVVSKSVAGGAGTTVLTQAEQRCQVLELTGALTGNRIVEVDETPWAWQVRNNTTGAFTVTLRVTGQTGVALQRGRRAIVYCDGVDVRHAENVVQRRAADVASAATIDLNVDGDLVDVTGNTGITAITLEDGREVTVRFTGTPALTHGASLVLISGANITMAAGDVATFRGYAAGVVRMTSFERASGKAVVLQTGSLSPGTVAQVNPAATGVNATAHGLGAAPDLVEAYLECLTAELGYSVGDRYQQPSSQNSSWSVATDATNVTILCQATPNVHRKDTAAVATITLANWKLVAVAYRRNT